MGTASVYDPGLVKASLGGIVFDGFAEGDMIDVEMLGDGTKVQVGTTGESAFTRSYNRSAKLTFSIMETSKVNAALTLYWQGGNPSKPFGLASLSTGAVLASGAGMLERVPGVTYSNEVPVRKWVVMIAALDQAIAGAL